MRSRNIAYGPTHAVASIDSAARVAEPMGRILFTLSGIIVVRIEKGSWLLPPQRALWIPGDTPYESLARRTGALQVLALHCQAGDVPRDPRLLPLSPFFRALLTEATRQGGLTMRTGRDTGLNAQIGRASCREGVCQYV